MASLVHHLNPSSHSPVFVKASQFKRRHQQYQPVSCSRNQNHDEDQKLVVVDRRNMLLGLGSLISTTLPPAASANGLNKRNLNAIETPEGKGSCSLSKYRSNKGQEMTVPCCLPQRQGDSMDYKLPPVSTMKIRRPANSVSPDYIADYKLATARMKALPLDDPRNFMQQANIHCAYCNSAYNQNGDGSLEIQVHDSWLFYPFHRWYLYFYERILAKMIDSPTFALPYWNWDHPSGMTIPEMFVNDPQSPLYDEKRNQKNMPPNVIDLGLHTRTTDEYSSDMVDNNLYVMYNEMLGSPADAFDFMGKRYVKGSNIGPGAGSIERGCHTSVHRWVGDVPENQPAGEDMGNFYSAGRDPLFYAHHANVDRMWTLWQANNRAQNKPSLGDCAFYKPEFLDASFVFYDENKELVRVTVADCLDNSKMGYEFEMGSYPSWVGYNHPPPKSVESRKRAAADGGSFGPLEGAWSFPVDKAGKGMQNEILVFEDMTADRTKSLKFEVFVSSKGSNEAVYAGTWGQLQQQHDHAKHRGAAQGTSFRVKLTDLYQEMGVKDDNDTITVTLVPWYEGPGVTIGNIYIIMNPEPNTSRKWFL